MYRGHRRVAHRYVRSVGSRKHRVILRARGRVPPDGRYELVVRQGGRTMARRTVAIPGEERRV